MGLYSIISTILLITAALTFTGLSESFSAAFLEEAEESCCDECNKGETEPPDHCSTPNCPLFVCLSMNIDSPLVLAVSFDGVYIPQPKKELVLEPLVRSIFHPPKSL